MRELFERHRPRMTSEEDRKLWGHLEKKLEHPHSMWRSWRIPVGATALATAAVAVVVLVRDVGVTRPGMNDGLEVRPAPLGQVESEAGRPATPAQESGKADAGSASGPERANLDVPKSLPMPPIVRRDAATLPVEEQDAVSSMALSQGEASAPREKGSLQAAAGATPTGTVTGRVTDERGTPLRFALIVIEGTSYEALTDSTGLFQIEHLPAGRYVAKVSFLGYDAKKLPLSVNAGAILAENVTLAETTVADMQSDMQSVVADAATGVSLRDGASATHGVGSEALERIPVEPEGSDLRQGVVSQGGQLHFRGGRKNETKLLLEGNGPPAAEAPATQAPSAPREEGTVWGRIKQVYPELKKDESGSPISVGGTDPVNGQDFDAMFFEHYGVNPFLDPQDDRFATFAVDVDNASYTLARSYLSRGSLPPKEAIRVEEFVNAFTHDYAPPGDALVASREWAPSEHGTFAIHLEAAPSPFGQDLVLFRVGLKGKEVTAAERKPAVLTFVVDVSGSMEREDRLELVKRALFLLLDQMDRRDQVGLVVYGSTARVILPPTSLAQRRAIEEAISRLRPEGATNAEAGLREGYAMADRGFTRGHLNRVILCSDGVANVGQTGAEDILRDIKAQARRGIYLTTVGFGMGNYNDVLMEKLANQGDGNYYYVDDISEAQRVFVENLTGTLQTIARDTKIQVEFDSDQVRRYRILGYENRDVADKDFRNDAVDAGEVGAGHEVTALFEMKLDSRAHGNVATVRIRYEDPETGKVTEEARTLRSEDIHRRLENADPTFRLDAAVVEFAEILRRSYWAKDGDLGRVHGLAQSVARSVPRPDEASEVISMIEVTRSLWSSNSPTPWRDDVRPRWEPGMDEDER